MLQRALKYCRQEKYGLAFTVFAVGFARLAFSSCQVASVMTTTRLWSSKAEWQQEMKQKDSALQDANKKLERHEAQRDALTKVLDTFENKVPAGRAPPHQSLWQHIMGGKSISTDAAKRLLDNARDAGGIPRPAREDSTFLTFL